MGSTFWILIQAPKRRVSVFFGSLGRSWKSNLEILVESQACGSCGLAIPIGMWASCALKSAFLQKNWIRPVLWRIDVLEDAREPCHRCCTGSHYNAGLQYCYGVHNGALSCISCIWFSDPPRILGLGSCKPHVVSTRLCPNQESVEIYDPYTPWSSKSLNQARTWETPSGRLCEFCHWSVVHQPERHFDVARGRRAPSQSQIPKGPCRYMVHTWGLLYPCYLCMY